MAAKDFQDVTGIPCCYFADSELLHEFVRLQVGQNLGGGYFLSAGERFRVEGVCGRGGERTLLLSNHRASRVPVSAWACELLFCWPVQEDSNG